MPNDQHHHYIPVFYLTQWSDARRRLIEFSRQGPARAVKPRPTSPKGTGYEPGLYAIDDSDPLVVNAVETLFLKPADGLASDALKCFLADSPFPRPQLRFSWARFVLSLMIRYPEAVAAMKKQLRENVEKMYLEHRKTDEPKTFAEYEVQQGTRDEMGRIHGRLLMDLMQDSRMGRLIFGMHWGVLKCKNYTYNLLTSDRPIVSNIFSTLSAHHLCLPISPAHVFVACATQQAETEFMQLDPLDVMGTINDAVAQQAKKYVWSTDEKQLRFVKNRMGNKKGAVGAYLV
jgi:hypothetical protein